MNEAVLKSRKRLRERLTKFLNNNPQGVTMSQISKTTDISTAMLCELLPEIGAEVKGDIWTLTVKQQSSNEVVDTPSIDPALTVNQQQPIKENPKMQQAQKLQKTGLFTNINAALEEQIKRLTQPDLDAETINLETMRTRGLTSISEQFIKQGQVVIEATKLDIEFGGNRVDSGLLTIGG